MQKVSKTSEIIQIALPATFGGITAVCSGMIDSYMVSSIGSDAVAAVGLSSVPQWFFFAIFLAMNVAVTSLVARRNGDRNRDGACGISITVLLITSVLTIIMGLVFSLFASPIMKLCGSNPQIHKAATEYFSIIIGCSFFNCLGMLINAILFGMGETKIPMITGILANVVNIIFNYLLIGGKCGFPALGIRGAAIATVLGLAVSTFFKFLALCRKDSFVSIPYIIREKIKPSYIYIKEIINMGYSVFAEQILLRTGNMLAGIMIAKQGTAALAAYNIVSLFSCFPFTIADSIRTAAVALVGRSLGEGNSKDARDYGGKSMHITNVMSTVICLLLLFAGEFLLKMYFKEPEIIKIGKNIIYISCLSVFFGDIQLVAMGCLHGAGDTKITAIIASSATIIMYVGVGYILTYLFKMGIYGMCVGQVLTNFSMFILAYFRFKSNRWEEIKI